MRLPWRSAVRGALAALLACAALAGAAAPLELSTAQRQIGSGPVESVTLPDRVHRLHESADPVIADYRLQVSLGAAPHGLSIYMPGLAAHARLNVNGHALADDLARLHEPLPTGLRQIRRWHVPDEFLVPGVNRIELRVGAASGLSLSTLFVGPDDTLRSMMERKVFLNVIGPALMATAIGCMAVCMLLLWARCHDAIYGYFAFGALGWALQNVWSALPWQLLPEPHNAIGWTWLYVVFVAMLVVFCLRFAEWHWPRFERGLWIACGVAPLAMYAGFAADALSATLMYLRLALIGSVVVGVAAVGSYAWRRRNVDSVLLAVTGAVSLAFGIRDWLIFRDGSAANPVELTPYAGLLFIGLVAWILIDRFVLATRSLERLNAELEQRVERKSAELVQAIDAMRAAKDSAEAANRAKSSFLASASHDLRQPIHALGLYMGALDSEALTPAQHEVAQRMHGSLAALESMFDALLDLSRMDAGALVPQPRGFAVAPLLQRLCEEMAPLAAERGLRLSLRVSRRIEACGAWSDPLLLERVLRNLVGNAIKYTASGGVLVSCCPRGGRAVFEVWDTGPGIAESERERVFEEYYQIGHPQRDRAGGLGLGLSIVRRLAQLLEHPLALHSSPGTGSRFALALPLVAQAPEALIEPAATGSLLGLHLVVIEDDPEVRDSMQLLLARWGCSVVSGADADEALPRLGPTPPDAIVADYRLRDGRTGLSETRRLWLACGRDVPALIVSGESSSATLAEIQASGLEWLSKPVLAARLRSWLWSVQQARQEVATCVS